jgi:hypothetical protein
MSSLLYIQQSGNIFEVRLTTTVPVNAWQGRLLLPPDLTVQEVAYGASFGDIWQAPPTLSGTEINFVGGATSAFTGDGLLFSFTAAPPAPPAALIRFDVAQTAFYAADSRASPVPLQLQPLPVDAAEIAAAAAGVPAADVTPPEPFQITLVPDSEEFGGQTVLVFATTDSGTGVDHYEVREETQKGAIDWHPARSPYLVNPDTTAILVKAVDRAGNFHIESIALRRSVFFGWEAALLAALLAAALMALYFMRRRRKAI